MKQVTKKTLLSVFVAALLVCSLILGILFVYPINADTVQAEEQATTTVTTTTDKTSLTPGDTMKLTVTINTTRTTFCYGAISLCIAPLSVDHKTANVEQAKWFTMNTNTWTISPYSKTGGYFQEQVADLFSDDTPDQKGALWSLAANISNKVPYANVPFVFTCEVTLDKNAPNNLGEMTWGVIETDLCSVGYSGIENNMPSPFDGYVDYADNRATGIWGDEITQTAPAFKNVTCTVGTKSASSEGDLTALKYGHGSATTNISTIATNMTGTSNSAILDNFFIAPTASPDATVKINDTPVKNGGSGKFTLSDTGVTEFTIVVTPQDGNAANTHTYKLTITSEYVSLASLTTKSLRPSGAPTVTLDGMVDGYDDARFNYTVNVPDDATAVEVTPTIKAGYGISNVIAHTAKGCNAAPDTTGKITVSNITTDAQLTLTLTAKDGKTTQNYVITFHVKSVDASIASLTATGKGDSKVYENEASVANSYIFNLSPAAKQQATLQIVGNKSQNITVNDKSYDKNALYGIGTVTVKVTAEAGNVATYLVTLNEVKVPAKFLKLSISINGTDYIPLLDEDDASFTSPADMKGNIYTKRVNLTETKSGVGSNILIKGIPSSGTTLTSTGLTETTATGSTEHTFTGTLAFGKNTYTITVSSSTGTNTYSFNLNLVEDKAAITAVTLTKGGTAIGNLEFNPSTKEYTVKVPYSRANASNPDAEREQIDSALLTVKTDGYYTVVQTEEDGGWKNFNGTIATSQTHTRQLQSLKVGTTTIKFRAVANNNISGLTDGNGLVGDIYTINIVREAAHTDATLSSLEVYIGGKKYEFTKPAKFNPSILNYAIEAGENDEGVVESAEVKIIARASDGTARVIGEGGTLTTLEGVNQFDVQVLAEDGTKQVYKITISKQEINFSNDFSMKSIVITGKSGTVWCNYTAPSTDPGYNNTITINVPYSEEYVVVNATPNYNASTIIGNGKILLTKIGSEGNLITVYAQAENGNNSDGASAFKFLFIRAEQRTATITGIVINGTPIAGFDADKKEYTFDCTSTTEAISISTTASDETAEIEIFSNGTSIVKGTGDNTTAQTVSLGEEGTLNNIIVSVSIDGNTEQYLIKVKRSSSKPLLEEIHLSNNVLQDKFEGGKNIDNTNLTSDEWMSTRDFYVTLSTLEDNLTLTVKGDSATSNISFGDPTDYEHFLTVTEVKVESTKATIKPKDMLGDSTKYTLTIQAVGHSGKQEYYRLHFRIISSSTNAAITPNALTPLNGFTYSNDETAYGPYTVSYSMTKLKFDVEFESGEGSYKILLRNKNGQYDLVNDNGTDRDGGLQLDWGINVVRVELTSGDGLNKKAVAIIVERAMPTLKGLKVTEAPNFNFDAKKTEFFVSVAADVENPTILPELDNTDMLRYEIMRPSETKAGTISDYIIQIYENGNTSTAVGTANGALNTITVHVFREPAETPFYWTIIFWVLVGLVVLELLIIIFMPKRKKGAAQQVVVQAPQGGYPMQGGYPPQGGYPQQPGYPSQGGYPQQPGYPPQGGYPQQPGYRQYPPQGGYPQQPGRPVPPADQGNHDDDDD